MGSLEVVVVGPGFQVGVSLLRFSPVFGVGPLAQCGLDKSLRLAVGSWRIGSGAAVFELHLLAGHAELAGAVAGAVVGEQGANPDAVAGEEVHRRVQEADGGLGLLIGK